MSSGGSNYSTGMTGGGNQVRIDSPASQQNGYGSAPAPGGKGGFPSAQSPYQQQPSVYMPPSQPSFYQQAFTQPRMEYGLGGMRGGNAYARPYSPGSPIERAPPVDEMRYVSGPTPIQQRVMPDTPPMARPAVMPRREYPVGPMPDMRIGDMGMSDMQFRTPSEYPTRAPPVNYSDMRIDSFGPPVEATRAVMPEPNYSGGLGSLMGGMSGSVPYPSSPSPSGFGPLQQQNPQLLAQMEMAKTAEAQRAAQLQQMKQNPSSSYSWNNGLWNA
jgi:hypothetical protein